MRFKPVPAPPDDLAAVVSILEAVPSTAGAVDDCCARLVDQTRLEDRSEAETWLAFLRALELVTDDNGYRRVSDLPPSVDTFDTERLALTFRDRVDGADEILEILETADEPLSATDVRDEFLASEGDTRADRYDTDRTERIRRLLAWAVLLEAAERTPGGRYRSRTADG